MLRLWCWVFMLLTFLCINMSDISLLQSAGLGLLQGFTEFLPVSSSGHLVIAESWFGVGAQELLSFDVALHFATLVALLVLFRREVVELLHVLVHPKQATEQERLMLIGIIASTVVLVVAGFFLADAMDVLRTPLVVGCAFIFSALLFVIAERCTRSTQTQMSTKSVVIAALLQVVALIPGVSRSGSVMAGAMLGGTERSSAARWSFLLGMPALAAAGSYQFLKLLSDPTVSSVGWLSLSVGMLVAGITAYFVAGFLIRFFRERSLYIFAVYLFILGVSIVVLETQA